MVFVFWASLFLYTLTISFVHLMADNDLWARLIVGKTFFQTGQLLNYDFLSFGPTRRWFDHEWGSSLVFWGIFDNFGEIGLLVFKILILFIIYFILVQLISLRRKHGKGTVCKNPIKEAPFNILFFVFLIQASANVMFSTVRCQLFTFLFFMMWFYILEKARLEGKYRPLWTLPASLIIWSNMHGGCFAGIGLLVLYGIGEYLNKKPVKPYIYTFLCCLAALFINPYGVEYVSFLFAAITLKREAITEWQPLFGFLNASKFMKFKIWGGVISLFGAFYCLRKFLSFKGNFKERALHFYQNLDKTKALILIVILDLSLKSVRMIPFFSFCAAAFLYDDFYKVFNKKLPNWINNLKEIFICMLILFSAVYTTNVYSIRIAIDEFPFVEAEFLKINNLKGNLFANFHFGSYLAYKLYPDNFIFMDGRYEETYDPKLLNILKRIYVDDDWKEALGEHHTDYIIAEKMYKDIINRLNNDPDWFSPVESKYFKLYINADSTKKRKFLIPSSDLEYYHKHKWETKIDWR